MSKTLHGVYGILVLAVGFRAPAVAQEQRPTPKPAVSYKAPPVFAPLEAGAVRPEGWLRDWAAAAAAGITGDLDQRAAVFEHGYKGYGFKAHGAGPDGTGWPVEQCAYWLDGLVRLAYILGDKALIEKAKARLDLVVDGVLKGGETFIYWRPKTAVKDAFNSWGHSHMGRALVAYYEATGDERILKALVNVYADYPLGGMSAQFGGVSGMCNVDPMFDTYVLSGDERILKLLLGFAGARGTQDVAERWAGGNVPQGHAVIYYENIRVPALLYPWTGDARMLKASQQVLDWGVQNHGLPMGLVSGEEHLAGIGSSRHVETCDVACGAWTYRTMVRVTGERKHADRMEQICFNAGPAFLARDYKTLAYYQCPNQLVAFPSDKNRPGGGRQFSKTAGTLCCVGNSSRVIPNFIMSMWMRRGDGGLAAVLYGPNVLRTKGGDGTPVTIECKTSYPFEEEIRMIVRPGKSTEFPLYLRLPSWCRQPELRLNDRIMPATPDELGFVKLARLWKEGDTVALRLPMHVTVLRGRETPYPQTRYFNVPLSKVKQVDNPYASVFYGPLLFAMPIPERDLNTPVTDAKWQYALDIDPDKPNGETKVVRGPMPNKWQWQLEAPVTLQVPAREFDWKPTELQPLPDKPVTEGKSTSLSLVPYGCAKFRLSMFPVTTKTWQNGPPGDASPKSAGR
jgi:hypothetical protein